MKVEIVYTYPCTGGDKWNELAFRFINSYHTHSPLAMHDTTIVCNGGVAPEEMQEMFKTLPNVRFFCHDNSGYEIGAYQSVSRVSSSSMIVLFAASTYFRKAGWLNRMIEAFRKHGGCALYGAMGNRGANGVWPHIRTTGFWLAPNFFNKYPHQVTKAEQRYEFEHGQTCLTEWVRNQGLKALVCDWQHEYEWIQWDAFPNGFHRGDQSGLLVGDRLSEPPYYPTP